MKRRGILFVVAGLGALVAGLSAPGLLRRSIQPVPPAVHPLTQRPIAGMATDGAWMDRQAREKEEAPDRALELAGIRPGMIVADIGAGTGYMTLRMARMVGPDGLVYANEIQPAMLRTLEGKVRDSGLSNVTVVRGTETDTGLPHGAVDLAVMVDVYHELRYPQAMLRSIEAALKPGGQLVLIEYRTEDPALPIAPTHRMSVDGARREVEAEGFTFDRLVPDLPRQHVLVFHRRGVSAAAK